MRFYWRSKREFGRRTGFRSQGFLATKQSEAVVEQFDEEADGMKVTPIQKTEDTSTDDTTTEDRYRINPVRCAVDGNRYSFVGRKIG